MGQTARTATLGDLPTGTVTFLLTDIGGSTRLWEHDPTAMHDAVRRHYQILQETVLSHRGALPVEQGEGDSIVAAFRNPRDALAAARDAQLSLTSETWPGGLEIQVRMSIHVGEARLRDAGNYAGETIIRAARLRSLAAPGQVLMSRAVVDLVGDRLPEGTTTVSLGRHRLKDLGREEDVFQLNHPSLPHDFPALRGIEDDSTNLPVQLTTFVGREADLAQVHALVEDVRLLTLTGAGGCGKTRLALQVAADRITLHPGGVWYVELAPLGDADAILETVLTAMHRSPVAGEPLIETLVRELSDKNVLLVVDNCEHLIEGAAEVIHTLLQRVPPLRVLATSRQTLNLPGETTWRVPSLSVPGNDEITVESLGQYDAVELFIERATRSRPGFAVTNDNAAAIAGICAELDGIPLAIELAAARVRSIPVHRIREGLTDRFRLLRGGSSALPTRQQTLLASVDWSHDLLDDADRMLFRRLSQFAGGFTLAAAEAVASGDEIDEWEVLDLLTHLVDRSLVQFDDQADRYRLLETMKQYGHSRLLDAGELESVLDRHAAYFCSVASQESPNFETAAQVDARRRLSPDNENLRIALERLESISDTERMATLACDLVFYWHQTGRFDQGDRWLTRAAELSGRTVLGARALWGRGYLNLYFGNFATAHELAEGAVRLGTELGDDFSHARGLDLGGDVIQMGDPRGALPLFEKALAIAQRSGDVWAQSDIIQKVAFSWLYADEFEAMEHWLEQSREVWGPGESPFFECWHYCALAWARIRTGHAAAAPDSERAKDRARANGDPTGEAWATWTQIVALSQRGAVERARAVHSETSAAFTKRGVHGAAPMLLELGGASLDLFEGDTASAIEAMQPIADFMAVEHCPPIEAAARIVLARSHLLRGSIDDARSDVDRLAELGEALESPYLRGTSRLLAAAAMLAERDPAGAMSELSDAVEIMPRTFRLGRWEALMLIGWANALSGEPVDARRYLRAAEVTQSGEGWELDGLQTSWLAAADDRLVADTGQDEEVMDLESALAHALRGRGRRLRPDSGWPSLTPAESTVVELITLGLSNPQIAERLFVSRSTVKTHLNHIYNKLGVTSRAELAAAAARRE